MADAIDRDLSDTDINADSENLPQAITESYGTGVQDQPGFAEGGRTMRDRMQAFNAADPGLSGGDIDAAWDQPMNGEEEVGGTAATPDQDIVDELGAAVGLEMDDRAFLRTTEILDARDDRRWELEPKSSEDYSDRQD